MPEFSLGLISALPQWREVMATADIADGQVRRVGCGVRRVFVYREGEHYRIYDSHCLHLVTNTPHLAAAALDLRPQRPARLLSPRAGFCPARHPGGKNTWGGLPGGYR